MHPGLQYSQRAPSQVLQPSCEVSWGQASTRIYGNTSRHCIYDAYIVIYPKPGSSLHKKPSSRAQRPNSNLPLRFFLPLPPTPNLVTFSLTISLLLVRAEQNFHFLFYSLSVSLSSLFSSPPAFTFFTFLVPSCFHFLYYSLPLLLSLSSLFSFSFTFFTFLFPSCFYFVYFSLPLLLSLSSLFSSPPAFTFFTFLFYSCFYCLYFSLPLLLSLSLLFSFPPAFTFFTFLFPSCFPELTPTPLIQATSQFQCCPKGFNAYVSHNEVRFTWISVFCSESRVSLSARCVSLGRLCFAENAENSLRLSRRPAVPPPSPDFYCCHP